MDNPVDIFSQQREVYQ